MEQRRVDPEVLDSLPADHPDAVHSRRDLRIIDFFMGNSRWIFRVLRKHVQPSDVVAEIGAGDGHLAEKLIPALPEGMAYWGLDLVAPPQGWRHGWQQGDIFAKGVPSDATVVLAGLVLHHFSNEQLAELGKRLRESSVRLLVAAEPFRAGLHLWQGKLLKLLRTCWVTDHDLAVSVRAGFRGGELVELLGLGGWRISLERTFFGSYRLVAQR
jgi:hypothetical protein